MFFSSIILRLGLLALICAFVVVQAASAASDEEITSNGAEPEYFVSYYKKAGPQGPLRFGKRRGGPSGPLRFGKRSGTPIFYGLPYDMN